MNPEKVRQIASRGGRAAHEKGTAHQYTREEAKKAGRKGGLLRWKKIGRDGMAALGRKGGSAPKRKVGTFV